MGRPQITEELRKAIVAIAGRNRDWGYGRIKGQLKYLGFKVSAATIGNICKQHGIEPQPSRTRKTTWHEFITHQWHSLVVQDIIRFFVLSSM